MEIFQGWHPDLNKRHFPRSADSEYVAVLAGQRSDGVIVPVNVSLIDGTTDQYALAANTEIALPPITIGKVIIQGIDDAGNKHDILATPNQDGTWNLSLTSPTLALEASQLTQIDLMLQSLVLSSQQVGQMTDLITTVATEITQLSVLHALSGLCINSPTLNQEITQLSVLQELQGLCFSAPTLNQEVTQLSILHEMEHLSVSVGDIDVNTDTLEELNRIQTATIAEGFTEVLISEWQIVDQLSDILTTAATEVTQLSVLYQLAGLTFDSPALNQEITQLSVLQTLENLSFTTPFPHGKYYAVETTQPAGMTDVMYDFGTRMQDVFLATSNPVSVKFGSVSNPVINLNNGRFSFEWQNTDKLFVTTTTVPVDLQIYANGGTT